MKADDPKPEPGAETYHTSPVQSFTCRAIRVTPGMKLEPRLGRPRRTGLNGKKSPGAPRNPKDGKKRGQ